MRHVKGITDDIVSARLLRYLKDAGQRIKRRSTGESEGVVQSRKRLRVCSDDSDN